MYKSKRTKNSSLPTDKFLFQNAAIYLNEGLDNDKFDNHPTRLTIKWYNIAHTTWYNIVDLMSSVLLLGLALGEKTGMLPSRDILSLPVVVNGILEIFILSTLAFGMLIKIKWQGVKFFFTHKRSLFKLIILCVMYIEAIVALVRDKNHVRITRALRPLFLIDSNYMQGTRRVLRQIMLSLPPVLDMLTLLLFFIFMFSMLGFYLFSSNSKDMFFTNFETSFVSLFILLTTANYPDVMMPSYATSRWSVIFFVAYISVASFLMSLLLAVVYESFTRMEKDKFIKLFLHKRNSAKKVYTMLCKGQDHGMSFARFNSLMKYFNPKHDDLQNYLLFRSLDKEVKGRVNLEEFYEIFEKNELVWRKVSECDGEWFHFMVHKPRCQFIYNCLRGIYCLIQKEMFEAFIYIAIVANGCSFAYEIIRISEMSAQERKFETLHSYWYNILFVAVYSAEALLKLLGLGLKRYFDSGWNCFDFIVTVLGIIGLIGAAENSYSFAFIVCLRPLRLLRLFKLKQRYKDVFDTMWVLTPRMFRVILVILCLYYSFGIIGMECFAGLNLKDCCANLSFGQSFEDDGYYYLNNFDDLTHAFVTLFELTVVNNWFIIMEGVVHLTSNWSRLYFMLFYVITMVVMAIVVAFILEAFLFRMKYRNSKELKSNEQINMTIKIEVEVTFEEIKKLNFKYCVGLRSGQSVIYRGKRHKTKMDLSMKMYRDEIEEWINQPETSQPKPSRIANFIEGLHKMCTRNATDESSNNENEV